MQIQLKILEINSSSYILYTSNVINNGITEQFHHRYIWSSEHCLHSSRYNEIRSYSLSAYHIYYQGVEYVYWVFDDTLLCEVQV